MICLSLRSGIAPVARVIFYEIRVCSPKNNGNTVKQGLLTVDARWESMRRGNRYAVGIDYLDWYGTHWFVRIGNLPSGSFGTSGHERNLIRMPKMLWFDSTNGKHGGILGAIPGHKLTYWVMTQKVSGPSHEYIHHDSSNAYWEQLCHIECPKFCGLTLQMANMGVFLVQFQGTN